MAPSDETDPDYQSRLNVSLETGSVPYDEVVAFTEHILNKNFDSLFQMHKDDMKDIVFNDPDAGVVEVELEAPRLIIPGNKDQAYGKEVFYMLRFKTGYVETATGLPRKMDGWQLAIPTTLNAEDVQPDKTIYKDIQIDEKTHQAVSVAGTIYKFPGDYSVERLFAQLTTAKWSEPNINLSLITDEEGKPMTIAEYCNTPNGSKIWALFAPVLQDWGIQQHNAGRSTLNVTFKLPEQRVNPQKPLYAPTSLYQQTYPYKCPAKGVVEPKTSRDGEGFNALLWCEMVAGHEAPTTKQLEWRGNYVIPERPYKGGDAIEGTFALSYKHFLEGHLLPRLQRLNQVSQVAKLSVSRSYNQSNNSFETDWNYEVGNFNNDSLHDNFKFDRESSNGDRDDAVVQYAWRRTGGIPESDRHYTWEGHGGTCATTEHNTTSAVVLSWKNGSSVFNLNGHTDYIFDNKVYPNGSRVDADKLSWLRYKYELDWTLEVAITSIKDGKMSIDVRTPQTPEPHEVANLTVRQTELKNERSEVPQGQEARIREQWLQRMKTCMADIERDIEQEFETTAKFVYPGNGDLVFSNPVISRFGNILAVVEHKPLDPKTLTEGKYITVQPALKIPKIIQPNYDPRSNHESQATPKPVVQLTWNLDPTTAVAKKTGRKFVLTGKNEGKTPVGLSYVWIRFSSGDEGPQLFRHEMINGVKGPYYKEPPSPTPAPAPTKEKVPAGKQNEKTKKKGLAGLLGGLGKALTADDDETEESPSSSGTAAPDVKSGDSEDPADGKVKPKAGTVGLPHRPPLDLNAPVVTPPAVAVAGATLTLKSSSPATMKLLPVQVNFWKETDDKTRWWQLTVKPEKKGDGFAVQPGESVTLEMANMDIGLAGTYMLVIRENWVLFPALTKPAKPSMSEDHVIEVVVSPF